MVMAEAMHISVQMVARHYGQCGWYDQQGARDRDEGMQLRLPRCCRVVSSFTGNGKGIVKRKKEEE